MGTNFNLCMHENKTKFMTSSMEFENIDQVLNIKKVYEYKYLGFKITFSKLKMIDLAK